MTNIPPDLKYSKTHEWLRSLPDGSVEVGVGCAPIACWRRISARHSRSIGIDPLLEMTLAAGKPDFAADVES
jgi:glycine cleavage system H lipoate-binding protein